MKAALAMVAWGLVTWTAVMPSFVKVCRRSPQSECKSNLKAWWTSQLAYRQEFGRYSPDPAAIGFSPERGNRYLYAWKPFGKFSRGGDPPGTAGILPDVGRAPVQLRAIPVIVTGGVRLGVTDAVATAVCVGQIDDDDALDVWSVSTAARIGLAGETISAGEPFHEQADRD